MKLAGLEEDVPIACNSAERLANGILVGEQGKGIGQTYDTSNYIASDLATV